MAKPKHKRVATGRGRTSESSDCRDIGANLYGKHCYLRMQTFFSLSGKPKGRSNGPRFRRRDFHPYYSWDKLPVKDRVDVLERWIHELKTFLKCIDMQLSEMKVAERKLFVRSLPGIFLKRR